MIRELKNEEAGELKILKGLGPLWTNFPPWYWNFTLLQLKKVKGGAAQWIRWAVM